MDAIGLVEFHDAILAKLSIEMGDVIHFEFSHISVYIEESPGIFVVWSFEGTLICEGVREVIVNMKLPLDVADVVDDCEILASDGQQAKIWSNRHADNVRVRITWCLSPGTVSCAARQAVLRLGKQIERLDTWNGPLS